MDYIKILNSFLDSAKEELKETGQLRPAAMFGTFENDGSDKFALGLVPLPPEMFNNGGAKDFISKMLKTVAKEIKPDFFVFITDAWMTMTTSLEEMEVKRAQFGQVENFPDRKEVIMVNIETKTEQLGKTLAYTRDENNKIEFEEPLLDDNTLPKFTGRFARILFEGEGPAIPKTNETLIPGMKPIGKN